MTTTLGHDTERLRLRQWRDTDRTPFAALNADPRVMEFFAAPLDRAASDALVDRAAARIAERGWGLWAVEERATRSFIGFVGLEDPGSELPCSPCVEIGWRLAQAHWGRGLATEAARAALEIGFEQYALAEIVSFTSVLNLPSEAVMKRLGMQRDAATFLHPRVPRGHPLQEHCLYRLGRERWRNGRESSPVP